MLELATNKEKQLNKSNFESYQDKRLLKNLIQRTGKKGSNKMDDVIQEITKKEIENQTIIVSGSNSNYLENVRQFDIEYLSLNDIHILNDVFSIFSQYNYLVFDNVQMKKQEELTIYKNIYSLASKHKKATFLWIGENELVEQTYNIKKN